MGFSAAVVLNYWVSSVQSFSSSEQAFARLGVIVNFHVDFCLRKTHERLIPIKFLKSFSESSR